MNSPLNTGILYASGGKTEEDMRVLSEAAAEKILGTMWTLMEEFPRIVQDGQITVSYRFHILTDDGLKVQLFSSLSENPFVSQRIARAICDDHNFKLARIWEQEQLEKQATPAPGIAKETAAPTDELF